MHNKCTQFFIASCLLLSLHNFLQAQGGTWVWLKGGTTANDTSVYGTQGVPDSNNTPQGLYEASNWIDKDGNLWVFGGVGYGSAIGTSDLWKYNPSNNQWTWMKGPGVMNQAGVYGTKGVPSPSNNPGGRGWGSLMWIDTSGDFWLFGGYGYDSFGNHGILNDLWRYHIATNEWTWMSGSDNWYDGTGEYGIYQQFTSWAVPTGRQECNSGWTDKDNKLWFFGGNGAIPDSLGYLQLNFNDVWCYSIGLNQWAWMNGPQNGENNGSYGMKGVESPSNLPSPRFSYTRWKDEAGNFYVCGAADNNGKENDVWRYNPVTNNWTWVAGDSTAASGGNLGQQCSNAEGSEPGAFAENRTAPMIGNTHIFPAFGGAPGGVMTNDLWTFNSQTMQWKWISGDSLTNYPGHYGTQGVPAASNNPTARAGHCMWVDYSGMIWIFAGLDSAVDNGFLNDLWKFIPDTSCLPCIYCGTECISTGNFNYHLAPSSLCPGDSAIISLSGDSGLRISPGNHVTWLDSLHAILKPDTTTLFTVTGYSSCGVQQSLSFSLPVAGGPVNITANKNAMCAGDSAAICAPEGFTSYQWNIVTDTTACINTTLPGNYQVTVTVNGRCTATSNPISITVHQPQAVMTSESGDTLTGYGASAYQWFLKGVALTGDTSAVYIAQAPGTYTLQTIDSNGCVATSTGILISGITEAPDDKSVAVFPNPTRTGWQLNVGAQLIGSKVVVYDATGRLVFQSPVQDLQSTINITGIASGVYELRLSWQGYSVVRKLVKL